VLLNGKTVSALIDTGADQSLLDTKTADEILGRKSDEGNAVDQEFVGLSGERVKAHRASFKNLSFSGIAVSDPQFLIAKIYHPTVKMVIGMDKLRFLHLFFAFKQNKVYATAAQ
jgi:predicted aspartyl protease